MSRPCVVRRAGLDDLPAVMALERATAEAPRWTEAMYRESLEPAAEAIQKKVLLVTDIGGSVQGFAALTALQGEAELESIAVAETVRRSGVGSALLKAAEAWASEQGAVALRLEVRASNVRAQTFYLARGFRKEDLRRGYYRDPAEDAVLMLRSLLEKAGAIGGAGIGDL